MNDNKCQLIYKGKVRDVYQISKNTLLMEATDRISAFNKNIGNIDGKGELINKMSTFWLNLSKSIIDNHLLYSTENYSIVKACTPFKIEIIVRAYMTGSTETSLWTHYKNGSRDYCGIKLRDNYKKNEKLDEIIITPTTKDDIDIPISKEDIVNKGFMTNKEIDFIYKKALELFKLGEEISSLSGFILVDTKYEFGKDKEENIILIDEVHTCDSSRYWLMNSYQDQFNKDCEPEKLDKDCVREWINSMCDPYSEEVPEIPKEIKLKAYNNYKRFYELISNVTLLDKRNNKVIIIAGSKNDKEHVESIENLLKEKRIGFESHYISAHRDSDKVLELIKHVEQEKQFNKNKKMIYVTVAGKSNALSGVVAANSSIPTIACPPFKDNSDMIININSSLQCPKFVPVMTILDPVNVVESIERIFKEGN